MEGVVDDVKVFLCCCTSFKVELYLFGRKERQGFVCLLSFAKFLFLFFIFFSCA